MTDSDFLLEVACNLDQHFAYTSEWLSAEDVRQACIGIGVYSGTASDYTITVHYAMLIDGSFQELGSFDVGPHTPFSIPSRYFRADVRADSGAGISPGNPIWVSVRKLS